MPQDQLVLQIFPRHDPARAITYAGDQEYIRGVLRDLGPRLEEARPGAGAEGLRILDDEPEGAGR